MSSSFIVVTKAGKMANKAEFVDNCMFVDRFIHGVLAYTLTICGLPASSLPTTECTDNIYRLTDFLKTAGASVLRLSLVKRDSWKRMFNSQRNSCGFSNENIHKFIANIVISHYRGRTYIIPSKLNILLSVCNEIILYMHFENIDIDFKRLFIEVSGCIVRITGLNRNDPEKLEALFDSFDDISGYTEWITDFISRFAIPYGSRDDVSDIFFECVTKFEEDVKNFKDSFIFLLYDYFSATSAGISLNSFELTSIRRDGQSPEPSNLSMDSEVGALGESKFLGNTSIRAENISEPLSQKDISKLEQRVAGEGLNSLARTISVSKDRKSMEQQKLPTDSEKGKNSENVAKSTLIQSDSKAQESLKLLSNSELGAVGRKTSENVTELTTFPNDSKSLEPPKLPTDSEMVAVGRKNSHRILSNCTETIFENLVEDNQSSDMYSEMALEQEFCSGSDVQETSPEIHDAKAKAKIAKEEKDIGKRKGILLLSSFMGFAFIVMCYKIYARKRRFK